VLKHRRKLLTDDIPDFDALQTNYLRAPAP
jgi:hypothetical protein